MAVMNKYKRTNFYDNQTVYGVSERDLVMNYWDLFTTKREIGYFTIGKEHIQRPDLVSIYVYGDIKYWWILSKFNMIDDWWNDIEVGRVLNVPDLMDIEDWFINVKRSKSSNV